MQTTTRTTLKMKDITIGMLVTVNDETARNPGGYGRVTARSPKHNQVRVDSGEFPGQEVTGWYPVTNVVVYAPPTPPTVTKEIGAYDPDSHDYPAYVVFEDGQKEYIGSRPTQRDASLLASDYIIQWYGDHHTPEAAARMIREELEQEGRHEQLARDMGGVWMDGGDPEAAHEWTPEYLLSLLTKETECAICHTQQQCFNAGESGYICERCVALAHVAAGRCSCGGAVEEEIDYTPLGPCAACGEDAWLTTAIGLLCPAHELLDPADPRCANCGDEHPHQRRADLGAALWAPETWECPDCARLSHMCPGCTQKAKGGTPVNPICTVHGCTNPATKEGLIPGLPVCDTCEPIAWERLRHAILGTALVEG